MEARNLNVERPKKAGPGRLSKNSLNFQVPAKEGAREVVKEMHGEHSWRNRILQFLHSHTVQYTLMFLLFLVSIYWSAPWMPVFFLRIDIMTDGS
jgi:hypothetical protein